MGQGFQRSLSSSSHAGREAETPPLETPLQQQMGPDTTDQRWQVMRKG